MKSRYHMYLLVVLLAAASGTTRGQMVPRTDVVWARTVSTPMTVDGVLDEPAWASAESVHIVYGIDNGMPGSGWFHENGLDSPTDSTHATVKFLVMGDSLYVGVKVLDKSVGGGSFNHFDGILSNIRQRQS